jgi:predicted DNA-binding transcriptional regulator YafY
MTRQGFCTRLFPSLMERVSLTSPQWVYRADMPRDDQLIRQWTLTRLLRGRIRRTFAQLAGELGVTKRTVQREIEVLTVAGFPVTSDVPNGTVFWHFTEGLHTETPIALTLTEQMALYFGKGLFKTEGART